MRTQSNAAPPLTRGDGCWGQRQGVNEAKTEKRPKRDGNKTKTITTDGELEDLESPWNNKIQQTDDT